MDPDYPCIHGANSRNCMPNQLSPGFVHHISECLWNLGLWNSNHTNNWWEWILKFFSVNYKKKFIFFNTEYGCKCRIYIFLIFETFRSFIFVHLYFTRESDGYEGPASVTRQRALYDLTSIYIQGQRTMSSQVVNMKNSYWYHQLLDWKVVECKNDIWLELYCIKFQF